MTLDQIARGESVRVVYVPGGDIRARMLRIGISEGSMIDCVLKIPAGPIVVRHGNLELALGRRLASAIEVAGGDA